MAKGGSPMGGGGFGGQRGGFDGALEPHRIVDGGGQQQGGFGGGFGGQQGGFGGGFGGQQGGFGNRQNDFDQTSFRNTEPRYQIPQNSTVVSPETIRSSGGSGGFGSMLGQRGGFGGQQSFGGYGGAPQQRFGGVTPQLQQGFQQFQQQQQQRQQSQQQRVQQAQQFKQAPRQNYNVAPPPKQQRPQFQQPFQNSQFSPQIMQAIQSFGGLGGFGGLGDLSGYGGYTMPQQQQAAQQPTYQQPYQQPYQQAAQQPYQIGFGGFGGYDMPQQQQFSEGNSEVQQQSFGGYGQSTLDTKNAAMLGYINQMGPEERGQYNAGVQQAAQDPSIQRQYDAFKSGQGQHMDPNVVRAIEDFRSQPQQQYAPPTEYYEPPRYTSPPAPNMSQTFTEAPRMQAMRAMQATDITGGRPVGRSEYTRED